MAQGALAEECRTLPILIESCDPLIASSVVSEADEDRTFTNFQFNVVYLGGIIGNHHEENRLQTWSRY